MIHKSKGKICFILDFRKFVYTYFNVYMDGQISLCENSDH